MIIYYLLFFFLFLLLIFDKLYSIQKKNEKTFKKIIKENEKIFFFSFLLNLNAFA